MPVGQFTAGNVNNNKNFTDDYVPGQDTVVAVPAADSTYMYIGGGRSIVDPTYHTTPAGYGYVDQLYTPDPYDETEVGICGAGNGGSRDSGANSGFPIKSVTAVGTVANGAAVEAGWTNRSGVSITVGQSVFGSGTTALVTPA